MTNTTEDLKLAPKNHFFRASLLAMLSVALLPLTAVANEVGPGLPRWVRIVLLPGESVAFVDSTRRNCYEVFIYSSGDTVGGRINSICGAGDSIVNSSGGNWVRFDIAGESNFLRLPDTVLPQDARQALQAVRAIMRPYEYVDSISVPGRWPFEYQDFKSTPKFKDDLTFHLNCSSTGISRAVTVRQRSSGWVFVGH